MISGLTVNTRKLAGALSRMMGHIVFRAAAFAALLICACVALTSPVYADTQLAPPPDKFVISPGGVDMRSGRYAYTHTDLSIGGESGLAFTRTLEQPGINHPGRFGSFSDNFDIFVQLIFVDNLKGDFRPNQGGDPQVEVIGGGLAQTFRSLSGSSWDLVSRANFAMLTPPPNNGVAPSVLTYQGSDGTTMVFRPIGSTDCAVGILCGNISQLTRPDGTVLTFAYDAVSGHARLRSVTSTRGYALLLDYSGTSTLVLRACMVNLAITQKPGSCPATSTTDIPVANYAYDANSGSQRLASVTDAGGAQWKFVNGTTTDTSGSFTPASVTMGFTNPGETSPWLTNSINLRTQDDGSVLEVITKQSFVDGRSYTYNYSLAPFDPPHVPVLAGGAIVDGQGRETDVVYDFPVLPTTGPGGTHSCPIATDFCMPSQTQINPDGSTSVVYQMTSGPTAITDPVGRTTSSGYCDPAETDGCVAAPDPFTTTDPSGIVTNMTWDFGTHHLGETDEVARTGSGLPDIVRRTGYDCLPSTIKFCDKPINGIDANGNETDLTYAPAHGGILSEMQPAPSAGAPRPLKLTTWVQKYAYITNGKSLVPAASPVFVINTETECQTVAGSSNANPVCDTTAAQRVTTYQYGADGTANNLYVHGISVAAGGQSRLTCFSYDSQGNKISQTSARAGLATCP
jgi:hypothetical protein